MNKNKFAQLRIGYTVNVMQWEEIKTLPGADLHDGKWSEWITINGGTFAVTKTIRDYFCGKAVEVAGVEDEAVVVENDGCEFYIPFSILK